MPYQDVQFAPSWDFTKDPIVEGSYEKMEDGVGEYKSKVYTIELKNGDKVSVWGSSVLDTQMGRVKLGENIQIEYLGEEDSKTRRGKKYKNFKVRVWVEDVKKDGVDLSNLPY